jgi:DNA-binding CsgD family transcriptional regulator
VPFLVPGVRAWLAVQRPDEAERWLAAAAEHLAGWEAMAGPAISHAEGLLKLATGSIAAARDALEAAARGWSDAHRVWEATWARLDLAQCLLRSNRVAEVAPPLVAARETATELRSGPLLARVDELERAARGRGSVDEPWRPLTAREFEVARLIAVGMTNGEIADELSIAPKTASAHVEHILAKLGVSRRAEIATWVATVASGAASVEAARGERVAAAR